jgi:hypothetical protein
MTIEATRPPFSIRSTSSSGWSILVFLVASFFNYREPIPLSLGTLIIFCAFGSVLAVLEVLPVLKLRHKKESKMKTILLSLAGALGIIVLLVLKNKGIFVWHELYLTGTCTLIALIIYVGCFLAEDRYFVRVYLALDGYHYVHA